MIKSCIGDDEDDDLSFVLNLFQAVNDSSCEFIGCCVSSDVLCLDLSCFQDIVNGIVDLLTVVIQVDVAQHFRGAKQHCSWIGDILADSF
jgi:hypothetical protein